MLNKTEIMQSYLDWINDYCNQEFELDKLPGGVKLALHRLMESHEELPPNVARVQVSDISVSYFHGDMPDSIKSLLKPYRKVKFL